MSPPSPPPRARDRATLEAEVRRIVDAGGAATPLRVLGSIAVAIHCPSAERLGAAFARTYADVDLAAYRRQAREVTALLGSLGYREDRDVTIRSEGRRGLFDHASGLHVDVFFDRLEFCHPIPLEGRLELDRPTIPLAELLLSKLQIVEINEKDVVDVILLLLDHEVASGDGDVIDGRIVARLCAADWGLWRTVTGNLAKVRALAATYPQLTADDRSRLDAQVAVVVSTLDAEPKTLGWRTRAKVGDRRRWWTEVDEVR